MTRLVTVPSTTGIWRAASRAASSAQNSAAGPWSHWVTSRTLDAFEYRDFARISANVVGHDQRYRRAQRVLTEAGACQVYWPIEVRL